MNNYQFPIFGTKEMIIIIVYYYYYFAPSVTPALTFYEASFFFLDLSGQQEHFKVTQEHLGFRTGSKSRRQARQHHLQLRLGLAGRAGASRRARRGCRGAALALPPCPNQTKRGLCHTLDFGLFFHTKIHPLKKSSKAQPVGWCFWHKQADKNIEPIDPHVLESQATRTALQSVPTWLFDSTTHNHSPTSWEATRKQGPRFISFHIK